MQGLSALCLPTRTTWTSVLEVLDYCFCLWLKHFLEHTKCWYNLVALYAFAQEHHPYFVSETLTVKAQDLIQCFAAEADFQSETASKNWVANMEKNIEDLKVAGWKLEEPKELEEPEGDLDEHHSVPSSPELSPYGEDDNEDVFKKPNPVQRPETLKSTPTQPEVIVISDSSSSVSPDKDFVPQGQQGLPALRKNQLWMKDDDPSVTHNKWVSKGEKSKNKECDLEPGAFFISRLTVTSNFFPSKSTFY